MLRKVAIGCIAMIAVLLTLALVVASRPAAFHIERSTTIAAPPEVVFPLVNDLRAWSRWSPYERKDPAMKRSYAGPGAGEGAVYGWVGNDDVGAGQMTIIRSVPNQRIAILLEFSRPFSATNQVEFVFDGSGDDTRVLWGMDGENGFMGKLISLVMDVDAMVGRDFEAGLAAMKSAAESDARRSAG